MFPDPSLEVVVIRQHVSVANSGNSPIKLTIRMESAAIVSQDVYNPTMTSIQQQWRTIRYWGQSMFSMLRVACCWHVVLATLLVASPSGGLLQSEEVESVESEIPVEECVDTLEFNLIGRPVPFRRSLVHTTRSAAAKGEDASRPQHFMPVLSPGDSISGHRLSNGLCAPLLC